MTIMRKSRLTQAVASAVFVAGLSFTVAAPVQAAPSYNPHGVGDVLLFPFYTVQNGYNSLFHLVNTSNDLTVVAKVRFREHKDSKDVLDFTVVMSPSDVFTGYLRANEKGNPQFVKSDNTCTSPQVEAKTAFLAPSDDTQLATAHTGHMEVLTMATISNKAIAAMAAGDKKTFLSAFVANAKHSASGTPANCTAVANTMVGADLVKLRSYVTNDVDGVTGGTAIQNALSGHFSVLNLAGGYSGASRPLVVSNASTATVSNPVDGNVNNLLAAQSSDEFYVPSLANVNGIRVTGSLANVATQAQKDAVTLATAQLAAAKAAQAAPASNTTLLTKLQVAKAAYDAAAANEKATDAALTAAPAPTVLAITYTNTAGSTTASAPVLLPAGSYVLVSPAGGSVDVPPVNTGITAAETALTTAGGVGATDAAVTAAESTLVALNNMVAITAGSAAASALADDKAYMTAVIAQLKINAALLKANIAATAAETAADTALASAEISLNAEAGAPVVVLAAPLPGVDPTNGSVLPLYATTLATKTTAAAAEATAVTTAQAALDAANKAITDAAPTLANVRLFKELEAAIADGTSSIQNEFTSKKGNSSTRSDMIITQNLKYVYQDSNLVSTVSSKVTSASIFAGGDTTPTVLWDTVDTALRGDDAMYINSGDNAGCVNVSYNLYNREENAGTVSVTPEVSGQTSAASGKMVCNETQVFGFNGGEMTTDKFSVATGFDHGWISVNLLNEKSANASGVANTGFSFWVRDFGGTDNYGGMIDNTHVKK